jgi:hypothetical protein
MLGAARSVEEMSGDAPLQPEREQQGGDERAARRLLKNASEPRTGPGARGDPERRL